MLLEGRRFVTGEVTVAEVHGAGVVRQRAGVGWQRDVAVGGVFGLRVCDIDRCADFYETEEFW